MPNLTKRYIDALTPVSARKIHWDDALKGFGLLQLPSGVLTFVLDYRNGEARKKRYTVGRFGPLTVEQARGRARVLQGRVELGDDPVAIEKTTRRAPTVSDLLDQYLLKHVAVENAPKTRASVEPIVENHIRPALGRLKTASVTKQDVLGLKRKMADTPRQANVALAILSKAMNLAEEWGMRPEGSNPCRRIARYRENARERFLSSEELGRLGEAFREAETIGLPWQEREGARAKHRAKPENRRTPVNSRAIAALRLLLFTGARLSEILELRWAHVDTKRGMIALPDRKGGTRREHPVNSMALALLADLPRVKKSPWVLPGPVDSTLPLSVSVAENAWSRIRACAGLNDVRIHDLRHTVGTLVSQTGANAFIVRDVLRHQTVAMTSRYANRDNDPVRAVSEVVGLEIVAALLGAKDGNAVSGEPSSSEKRR